MLRVRADGTDFVLFRPREVVDLIDKERSRLIKLRPQSPLIIKGLYLKDEPVPDGLFCLPGDALGRPYVSRAVAEQVMAADPIGLTFEDAEGVMP